MLFTFRSSGEPPSNKSEYTRSRRAFSIRAYKRPIRVRVDGARFVLVEGLHRLEAAKALGEKTIVCFLVDARKH
jgi:hypothetical protein